MKEMKKEMKIIIVQEKDDKEKINKEMEIGD